MLIATWRSTSGGESHWAYDDCADNPDVVGFHGLYGADAIRALDKEVVRLAQEWLDQRHA